MFVDRVSVLGGLSVCDLPLRQLVGLLHQVPHRAQAEEGVPGDQEVAGDTLQDPAGERATGKQRYTLLRDRVIIIIIVPQIKGP